MHQPIYTRATVNDAQLLADKRTEFLTEFWGAQNQETITLLKTELRKYFEHSLANRSYISWIATINNEFASMGGMVLLQKPGSFRVPDGKCGYIMNMYTVPKYRRMGLATEISNHMIEDGKHAGITFFELHATHDGEPMYLKNGFNLHTEPTYRKFV